MSPRGLGDGTQRHLHLEYQCFKILYILELDKALTKWSLSKAFLVIRKSIIHSLHKLAKFEHFLSPPRVRVKVNGA